MKIGLVFQRILPPIWFGITVAIALESWLKFQAHGITRELGLGIGKLVFTAIGRVELVIAALLALALFVVASPRIVRLIFAAIAAILLAQTFWLMPALVVRIDTIVAGSPPPPSSIHIVYVALEMVKLLLLLGLSIAVSWSVEGKK